MYRILDYKRRVINTAFSLAGAELMIQKYAITAAFLKFPDGTVKAL